MPVTTPIEYDDARNNHFVKNKSFRKPVQNTENNTENNTEINIQKTENTTENTTENPTDNDLLQLIETTVRLLEFRNE